MLERREAARARARRAQVGELPSSMPGGFDPTRGDPVHGYERPRKAYTDADREAILKAIPDERQKHNDQNVVDFAIDFSVAIIELWSPHLTEQMSQAAAARAIVDWGTFTETFLEEALITILGMGIGEVAGITAEVIFADHLKRELVVKLSEVFGEAGVKTGNEGAKSQTRAR